MNGLTELVFILDRSGSMAGLESDTIGGFNGMIQKQKKETGRANVTTVLFDDRCELIHDRVSLDKIRPLTSEEYYVHGGRNHSYLLRCAVSRSPCAADHTADSEQDYPSARFRSERIKADPGQLPRLQCFNHRRVVNHLAAGRIDKVGIFRHLREKLPAAHTGRLRCHRDVNTHDIAGAEQIIQRQERYVILLLFFLRNPVPLFVINFRPEGDEKPCDSLPISPKPTSPTFISLSSGISCDIRYIFVSIWCPARTLR